MGRRAGCLAASRRLCLSRHERLPFEGTTSLTLLTSRGPCNPCLHCIASKLQLATSGWAAEIHDTMMPARCVFTCLFIKQLCPGIDPPFSSCIDCHLTRP